MYNNSTKETWRGFVWNQVKERLPRNTPGRVCVLAGDIAADLPCAKKRGLECVAVDRNAKCVRKFRKEGGVAIQDDLHHQVTSMQPNALIADLVCGLLPSTLAMYGDAVAVCDVVVFNWCRGRDRGMHEMSGIVPEYIKGRRFGREIGKHRGHIAFMLSLPVIAELWYEMHIDRVYPRWLIEEVAEYMQPRFYQYRSKDSGQYFDSIAVTTSAFQIANGSPNKIRLMAPVKSRRKTAAAKAILTKRRQHATD